MNIGKNIGMKRRNGDEGCLLGVLGGSLMGEVDTHMHILHSTFWGSWGVLGGYWSGLGRSLGGLGIIFGGLLGFVRALGGCLACYLVPLGAT